MYLSVVKPVIDRVFAFLLVITLGLPFVFVCLILWIFHGAPVFFVQERAGKGGKPFKMLKLRTMSGNGQNLRITRLGSLLRRTSIDEIPQVWNILGGNMSFVGPRPLLVSYVPRYSREQRNRLTVMPGITGWAQVNGRTSIPWNEKLDLDVYYVKNCSIALDLVILIKTFVLVLSFKEDTSVSEEPFNPS
ncbi:MAG TPA: sugar transferase [Cyclobacteriaceae bacterium]|nr:sugar transferase [Cyclobacteriaceae bacterium]